MEKVLTEKQAKSLLKKKLRRNKVFTAIIVLGVVLGFFIGRIENMYFLVPIGFFVMLFGVFALAIVNYMEYKSGTSVQHLYSENFLAPAIEKLLPQNSQLKYFEHIQSDKGVKSVLRTTARTIDGSCYIKTTYKDLEIEMSNLMATHESVDSDGDRHTVLDFRGQIFITDFNLPINGSIRIVPTKTIKIINKETNNGYKRKENTEKQIETENIAFNEKYNVFAKDSNDAFYVLSPFVLEYLKNAESPLCIYISNGKMYIAKSGKYVFSVEGMSGKEIDQLSVPNEYENLTQFYNDIFEMLKSIKNNNINR